MPSIFYLHSVHNIQVLIAVVRSWKMFRLLIPKQRNKDQPVSTNSTIGWNFGRRREVAVAALNIEPLNWDVTGWRGELGSRWKTNFQTL